MRTLSSRTDSADSASPGASGLGAGPDAESPRAGSLARAGLSALGAGLLALVRGTGVLARGAGVLVRGAPVLVRGARVLARGAGKLALAIGARVRRWRIPERAGRAALAVAASSALIGVRVWLLCGARSSRPARPSRSAGQAGRYRSAPPARPARPPVRLTARGGLVIMFGACFLGLLLADWANWTELADAVFFMASSLTAYYVRAGSLLPVAVSPPLLFFAAMTIEKFVVASGTLAAFEGTLIMLASATTWLFAGTALTLTIALLRGLPREIRALILDLRNS